MVIYASARRHGIADNEIRAVLEHPIVRYRLTPRSEPDAQLIRMVGDPLGGRLVEVVAWPTGSVADRERSGRNHEQPQRCRGALCPAC